MTTEKQAVVEEAKDVAQPTPEAESARDVPLDELLSQFDSAKPAVVSPPEVPKAETPQETVPAWAQELQHRYHEESVKDVESRVFDGIETSDRLKRAWIEQIAKEEPGIAKAWIERNLNPAKWKAVEKYLAKEAHKEFAQKVDKEATADRDAVAAAVRGASTTKPPAEPAPKLGSMSSSEFYKYTRENFGF